ncbi:Inositol monophosphatase 2 [Varanus komodoensis]|nr:Inositol monophosphatase 2 [Varanus komodoensis]
MGTRPPRGPGPRAAAARFDGQTAPSLGRGAAPRSLLPGAGRAEEGSGPRRRAGRALRGASSEQVLRLPAAEAARGPAARRKEPPLSPQPLRCRKRSSGERTGAPRGAAMKPSAGRGAAAGGADDPWKECVEVAVQLALRAGQIIQKALTEEKQVSTKTSAADLVTETDHFVENLIVSALKEKFPTHRFV